MALAAHPGWTRSNLAGSGGALERQPGPAPAEPAGRDRHFGQSAAGGALPVLCAATARGRPQRAVHRTGAASSGCTGRPASPDPSRRARDLDDGGAPVGGVRGADRRALLGGRRRLNAPAAGPVHVIERSGRPERREEAGVRRNPVGPQHAAEDDDDDRGGAGAAERGRRALGSGPADVGVVEQHHATTGDDGSAAGASRRRHGWRGAYARPARRCGTTRCGDQRAPGNADSTRDARPSTRTRGEPPGRTDDGTGSDDLGAPPAAAATHGAWVCRKSAKSERTIDENRARASSSGASL